MKNYLLLFTLLLLFSCTKTPDLTKKVRLNMTYNEVLDTLGKPNSRVSYVNADGNLVHKIRYENTENFSGYGFTVVFNDSLKVIDRNYD